MKWTLPLFLAVPFLAGANGRGCESTGSTADGGTREPPPADASNSADASNTQEDASPAYDACATCGATPDGGYPTGLACTTSADCPAHGECGYPAAEGCAATSGTCFPPYTGVLCHSEILGCGCHGGAVSIPNCPPLPAGYVLQPYASTAACPATTCTKDADCGSGQICGFLEADACAAIGKCFDAPTGVALCDSGTTGCGCNGTEVFVPNCTDLPSGYLPQPIKSRGACEAGAP